MGDQPTTPSSCGRSSRSRGGPTPLSATDWASAPAKLRKLAPGGQGGRGAAAFIQTDWQIESVVPFSPVAAAAATPATKRMKSPPPPSLQKKEKKMPLEVRAIVENEGLINLIEDNCVCRFCHEDLKFSLPTCCVTAIPQLECVNKGCSASVIKASYQTTQLPSASSRKQQTDFACNILYVLSFIASGDGGCEAQRVLGFLGIAHFCSMAKSSFSAIEQRITHAIQAVTNAALELNLQEEVRLSMQDDIDFNYNEWKNAYINNLVNYSPARYPRLSVGTDMGWQKRSSGRRYDSRSGHAFLVGMCSRKPIMMSVKITFCRKCAYYYKDDENIPVIRIHRCTINHEGGAPAMEAAALVDMYTDMYDRFKCALKAVVADDDTKMPVRCNWNSASHPLGLGHANGTLRNNIPRPNFLADPAHRKKTVRNKLYKLLQKKKGDRHGFTEGDLLRIVTNFIYCVRQLPTILEDEWVDSVKAVLDHHFDDHKNCGEYCQRKKDLEFHIPDDGTKVYRCKTKDKKLYDVLTALLANFITLERLREVGHGMDTNVNESLNNSIAWLAPKNKTYSGSDSLLNRVAMAIGINALGYERFYTAVFRELGIDVPAATTMYLSQQTQSRDSRTALRRMPVNKRRRNKRTYAKLKKLNQQLVQDRKNGDEYKPGCRVKKAKQTTAVIVGDSVRQCVCGSTTHQRSNHRECPRNKKNQAATEVLQALGEEQALLDAIDPSVEATRAVVALGVLQEADDDADADSEKESTDNLSDEEGGDYLNN